MKLQLFGQQVSLCGQTGLIIFMKQTSMFFMSFLVYLFFVFISCFCILIYFNLLFY